MVYNDDCTKDMACIYLTPHEAKCASCKEAMFISEQADDGWVEYRLGYNDRVCCLWLYESRGLFEDDDEEQEDDEEGEDEDDEEEWQEWNDENDWNVGENEEVWNLIDWMNDDEECPPPIFHQ